MKPKDMIVLVAVVVLFSPIAYFLVLLMSGNARIEFGPVEKREATPPVIPFMGFSENRKDSLMARNSKTFQALEEERRRIAIEKEQLEKQRDGLNSLQKDIETQKAAIEKERKTLEELVKQSSEMELKRTRQLARVYASMKPVEAAQVIETLDEQSAAKLLDAMSDDRQKAKIMASLTKEKAARLSTLLGKSPIKR